MMSQAVEILKQYWGYDAFRGLQANIIDSVMNKKDTLALLPTGGGKSICFQVPSLCFETGVTLVISPLIALMKDQVSNLEKRGIRAGALYSGQHYKEMERILDNAQNNYLRFLYLSPERLKTDLFKIRLFQLKINLVAIDEAHCVSQWGYDFRPSYLEIKELRETLKEVPFVALTATATPRVKKDIIDKLGLKQAQVFQQSYRRPNLSYSVLYQEDKLKKLVDIFKKVPGTGIVYVRSRKKTSDIATWLNKNGISADIYHAGLTAQLKDAKQAAWMQNKTRVIVCTNAFGMGIDKPDVRMVVHVELPESIEAYFQEAGRAGRDGNKAFATMLFQTADALRLNKNLEQTFPDEQLIKRVYHSLGNHFRMAIGAGKGQSFPFYIEAHAKEYNFKLTDLFHALNILQDEEYIHLSDSYFEPSKIKIISNRNDLYEFQVKFQQYNALIKTILRSLDGVMDEFVVIKEQILAQQININKETVIEQLQLLHKNKVIYYIPQHEQPMLTFVTERLAPENIGFNKANLAFRKEVQHNNVKSMIAYAETKDLCRSVQLLAYFGETGGENCGVCDVCFGRNLPDTQEAKTQKIQQKLNTILKNKPLNMEAIIEAFPQMDKTIVTQAIRELLDNGFLGIDANKSLFLPFEN